MSRRPPDPDPEPNPDPDTLGPEPGLKPKPESEPEHHPNHEPDVTASDSDNGKLNSVYMNAEVDDDGQDVRLKVTSLGWFNDWLSDHGYKRIKDVNEDTLQQKRCRLPNWVDRWSQLLAGEFGSKKRVQGGSICYGFKIIKNDWGLHPQGAAKKAANIIGYDAFGDPALAPQSFKPVSETKDNMSSRLYLPNHMVENMNHYASLLGCGQGDVIRHCMYVAVRYTNESSKGTKWYENARERTERLKEAFEGRLELAEQMQESVDPEEDVRQLLPD